MEAAHNVVLRGGLADGVTLAWPEIGTPIEWEDVGGGVATYVFADVEETVEGLRMSVYRLPERRS